MSEKHCFVYHYQQKFGVPEVFSYYYEGKTYIKKVEFLSFSVKKMNNPLPSEYL